jgi:hypothetical protein
MRNLSFLPSERHELADCLLSVIIGLWSDGTQLHANKQNYKKVDGGKYSPQRDPASHCIGRQFSLWVFLHMLFVFVPNRQEANIVSEINLLNHTYSNLFNFLYG